MKRFMYALLSSLLGFVVLFLVSFSIFLTKPEPDNTEIIETGWQIALFLFGALGWCAGQILAVMIATELYEFPSKREKEDGL